MIKIPGSGLDIEDSTHAALGLTSATTNLPLSGAQGPTLRPCVALVVTLHDVLNDTKAFNIERVHRMANDPCGFRYSDHSSCLFVGLLDT